MTACGRRGKPKAGFPRASTVLGNRKSRDSHIPTAAARRGKVENQKQVSHFPTCCFFFPQNESERRPGGGSLRSRLQAHSWIRKCCLEPYGTAGLLRCLSGARRIVLSCKESGDNMIRTQISLDKEEYALAKKEAAALGI